MRRFMPVDTATAALGGERAFKFCAAHKFQFLTVHKLRFSETPLDSVFSVGCGFRKIRPKGRPIVRESQPEDALIPRFA